MKSLGITSGKGGVGKTTVSANLAAAYAKQGKKVLVFDADLGLANLDIAVGLRPEKNLSHAVRGECPLNEAVAETEHGFDIVAGGSGVEELVQLKEAELDGLLKQVAEVAEGYDIVIYDTAAGLGAQVLSFLLLSDEVVVVCEPEPASVMDAYATLKSVFGKETEARVWLVVNAADSRKQAEDIYGKIEKICANFLGHKVQEGGFIRFDEKAVLAGRRRQLYTTAFTKSSAAKDLTQVSERFLAEVETPSDEGLSLLERLRSAFHKAKTEPEPEAKEPKKEAEKQPEPEATEEAESDKTEDTGDKPAA
jgi:flagellar biosynthesis protein FlhG